MGKKKGGRQPEPESDSEGSEPQMDEADVKAQLARFMNPHYAEELVAKLEPAVRNRVHALQGIQQDYNSLRAAELEEHKALKQKYEALYQPFFQRRSEVIKGEREPTDEEVTHGIPEFYQPSEEAETKNDGGKGIKDFWLGAFNNCSAIADMITERDEKALTHLTNVTAHNFPDPSQGFELEFFFEPNEYFTNSSITKKYHLIDEDDVVLDRAEGCEIDWKAGKNLTKILKKKKQKAKGGKNTRTVTKEEDCDSFFNFFKPPQLPSGEDSEEMDDEDEDERLEELVEADYEIGEMLKDLVGSAAKWYTGETNDCVDQSDDEEGEEDDEDDESEDEAPKPKPKGGKKPKPGGGDTAAGAQAQAPDCKQQ